MRKSYPLLMCLFVLRLSGSAIYPAAVHAQRPDGLITRPPADKGRTHVPADLQVERITVKFHEGAHVRLRGGVFMAFDRDERERRDLEALKLTQADVHRDIAEARRLIGIAPQVKALRRLFSDQSEELLAQLKRQGEESSGRQLADLDLYYALDVKPGTTGEQVQELIEQLNALPSIEIAYADAPAKPTGRDLLRSITAASTTPNFQSQQGYLNPSPQGIDALYAWTVPGGKGEGSTAVDDEIKIVDVERAWRLTHEDLPPVFHQGGTQSTQQNWRVHGTAVLGELAAMNNGFGVTGIAHMAKIGVQSALTGGRAQAILNAALATGPGGVVLIEVQVEVEDSDPDCDDSSCPLIDCEFVPVEYIQDDFDAISTVTANGTIVVEPAGNGGMSLDKVFFADKFNRNYRDSGAILVGASLSSSRTPICQTNYGSRVDLHGWGENVVTTGGFSPYLQTGCPDEICDYTTNFTSTSSASPMVAASAAILRSVALAHGTPTIPPSAMRNLLANTGTPQVASPKNIGPLPNLRTSIDGLLYDQEPPLAKFTLTCTGLSCIFDARSSADNLAISSYDWSYGDGTTNYRPVTGHFYLATGIYTVTLTVTDVAGLQSSTSRKVSVTSDPIAPAHSYFTVAPCRLLDTILTNNLPIVANIAGSCGIPSTAKAVSFNVTAMAPTGSGKVRLYPGNLTASAPGSNSSIHFTPATAPRANSAVIKLATNGAGTLGIHAEVAGSPGQVRLILDIQGYFSTDTSPAPGAQGPLGFQTLPPCRMADTRPSSPLVAGTGRTFTAQGVCGVPVGAAVASLQIGVPGPASSGSGSITLYPSNITLPGVSTISFPSGTPHLRNGARVSLSPSTPDFAAMFTGTAGASVHAYFDVNGYFKSDAPLKYHPITPCRSVDTGDPAMGGSPLVTGTVRTFQIQGNCGIPVGAKAALLRLVIGSPTSSGDLSVFPSNVSQPAVSTVKFDANEPGLSMGTIVPLATLIDDLAVTPGQMTAGGTVGLAIDVFGYFK